MTVDTNIQMYRDSKGRMTSLIVHHPFPCTVGWHMTPSDPYKIKLPELARDYWIDMNLCTTCRKMNDNDVVTAFRKVITDTSHRYFTRSNAKIDEAIRFAIIGC